MAAVTPRLAAVCESYKKFGATYTDFCCAQENAVQSLQDAYGYDAVTDDRFLVDDGDLTDEFLELVESGLEAYRSEGTLGRP